MTSSSRARIIQLILSCCCAMFMLVPAANASIEITRPAANALVNAGSKFPVAYTLTCPEGKECGSSGSTKVYPQLQVNLEHATLDSDTKGLEGDSWAQFDYSTAPYVFTLNEYMTAGPWDVKASWKECTPPETGGFYNDENCETVSATRRFNVRTIIGTKSEKIASNIHAGAYGVTRKVRHNLTFGCNLTAESARVSVLVQKLVRVNKRNRWVAVLSQRNQKFDPAYVGRRCTFWRDTTMPGSVSRSTKLRTVFTVQTVGFKPAVTRTTTSASYTLTSLMQGGGGIVIGG